MQVDIRDATCFKKKSGIPQLSDSGHCPHHLFRQGQIVYIQGQEHFREG